MTWRLTGAWGHMQAHRGRHTLQHHWTLHASVWAATTGWASAAKLSDQPKHTPRTEVAVMVTAGGICGSRSSSSTCATAAAAARGARAHRTHLHTTRTCGGHDAPSSRGLLVRCARHHLRSLRSGGQGGSLGSMVGGGNHLQAGSAVTELKRGLAAELPRHTYIYTHTRAHARMQTRTHTLTLMPVRSRPLLSTRAS